MKIGIDASNIKAGGGLTHLKELLEHSDGLLQKYDITTIVIWGGRQLDKIADYPWLIKVIPTELLQGGFINETYWKLLKRKRAFLEQCDILFVPGGVYSSRDLTYVSMSQNMLVFEREERKRYGISWNRLRIKLLNYLQTKSFKNASGIIFISEFASSIIVPRVKNNNFRIIHHGISDRFSNEAKAQRYIDSYTTENPFKLLYISTIDVYKHQSLIAEAVSKVRDKGVNIEIHFVGGSYPKSLQKLEQKILELDPKKQFLKCHGLVPYEKIDGFYKECDGFIFGSTCENMPNIIIEAMHSGLPILSSEKQPMPEFLQDAAFYFNPLDVDDTESALEYFLSTPEMRLERAQKAKIYAEKYSWIRCADETLKYLKDIYVANQM